MKQIPNLFTLLNLVLGCMAIVFCLQNGFTVVETEANTGNAMGLELVFIREKLYLASLFIGLAAVVDFFDGFLARALGASSEMGKQLDSLADVVSFGVAPSLIIYQFLRLGIARQEDGLNAPVFWLIPAFILAAAAAYRLAKFNLDTRQTHSFRGTPVPSVGLTVASFPLIYAGDQPQWVFDLLVNKWFLYAVVVVLSWLMVSDIPIMSNKPRSKKLTDLVPHISLLVLGLVSVFLLGWLAVPLIFIGFVVLSLLFQKQL